MHTSLDQLALNGKLPLTPSPLIAHPLSPTPQCSLTAIHHHPSPYPLLSNPEAPLVLFHEPWGALVIVGRSTERERVLHPW